MKALLQNQIEGMIQGALNFNHSYQIIDKRIVYMDGDQLSYKINYGYKTIFAYIH